MARSLEPDGVAAAKARLRAELRAIRRTVAADADERAARSARIWAGVLARVALRPGTRVLLFESLPAEPDTAGWAAWCIGRQVAVFHPEVDGPALRVQPGGVDPATLDVAIVPGLGFTADGRRLGQGGGHYDRFLPRLRPGCVTVGVCFAEQLIPDLPVEPHDARVDVVVTDAAGPG